MDLHIKSKKYNDADVLEVKEDLALKSEVGSKLIVGTYIEVEEAPEKWSFKYVDVIPDDYSGPAYYFGDDYFSLQHIENGSMVDEIIIDIFDGTSKINFVALTFSLNQLDSTLRQLVESAISSGEAVACSQAQWYVIKDKLDKCLYLNYNDYSMIKSVSGIDYYLFGFTDPNTTDAGESFKIIWDNGLLTASFKEV